MPMAGEWSQIIRKRKSLIFFLLSFFQALDHWSLPTGSHAKPREDCFVNSVLCRVWYGLSWIWRWSPGPVSPSSYSSHSRISGQDSNDMLFTMLIETTVERGSPCWLLKLRRMGTQGVYMNGSLPWLDCWVHLAGTRDFCPSLAALVGPVQNIYFLTISHSFNAWGGPTTASPKF
jgi:hypothetical protein